jgi:hypothetical protein
VPLERPAGHATALRFAVGEALAALVTACAAEAFVEGQALVVEQRLAERPLRFGERIVGGKRHPFGPAE